MNATDYVCVCELWVRAIVYEYVCASLHTLLRNNIGGRFNVTALGSTHDSVGI